MVIFTIGRKLAYEAALDDPAVEKPLKMGKSDDYVGGSVWKTPEGARKNCPPGFIVYGVLADWEKDTAPSKEGNWHDLLKDSEFVRLPDELKPKHKRKK
jgi:hypothetical protein